MQPITSWELEEEALSMCNEWSHKRSTSSVADEVNIESEWELSQGFSNLEELKACPSRVEEISKRLKCVYENEGIDYGSDESGADGLLARYRVLTQMRKERIKYVMREIRQSRNVELCFLVDATGSMQDHIDGVRKSIKQIADSLKDTDIRPKLKNSVSMAKSKKEMKIALVAYRDHRDENQFEVLGFTDSIPDFEAFCERIVADGGGDTPEDVFGGLEKALELEWSTKACTKVIFHICDAPCHGKEFHTDSELRDNYPAGDPKGRKHTDLFAGLLSKRIQYYFGKINDSTDKMLEKFSEVYGDQIVDFDVGNIENIIKSVTTAVNISIGNVAEASRKSIRTVKKERIFTLKRAEPDWKSCPLLKGKFISYEFPASIQDIVDDVPLKRTSPKVAEIKISPNPFAKGAERIAFYGKDMSPIVKEGQITPSDKTTENIVLKEYLHEGGGINFARRYEYSNQMQTIAAFLATKFMEEIHEMTGVKAIKFVKIRTLSLQLSDRVRYLSAEKRFNPEDKFIRFSNNVGYEIMEERALALGISYDFIQLVTAFSHWTHKVTGGFLMVVDLEGVVTNIYSGEVGVLLTDPAIHCRDLTRFGPMNHGTDGIINFFSQHKCNKYCSYLELV